MTGGYAFATDSAQLQYRQNGFRRSAERRLITDYDDWTFNQNRVLDHKLQPGVFRSIVFGRQPMFFGDHFFKPNDVLWSLTQELEKPLQFCLRRRRLEVIDYDWLHAMPIEKLERRPTLAAARIVVDNCLQCGAAVTLTQLT